MLPVLQDIVNDKKKLIALIVGLLVFLYIDFAFVIGAQMKEANAAKKKIVDLRKDIESFKSDSAFVKKTSRPSAAPIALKRLPAEREIPSVMQAISAIANENGVRIMQIDASRNVKSSRKSPAQSRSKKGAKAAPDTDPAAGLTQVNIRLDIVAGYHNLGNFINGIENAEKLCIIEDMTITRDASNPLKQNVNMAVKTYVKK